jgi:hypothetical protein
MGRLNRQKPLPGQMTGASVHETAPYEHRNAILAISGIVCG